MTEAIKFLVNWIRSGLLVQLKRYFCWIVSKFLEWGEAGLDLVFPLIPDGPAEAVQWFSGILGTAGHFFPVGAAIVTISTVMTVYIGCMALRIIRRILPF